MPATSRKNVSISGTEATVETLASRDSIAERTAVLKTATA
jgi:hypothetical protein